MQHAPRTSQEAHEYSLRRSRALELAVELAIEVAKLEAKIEPTDITIARATTFEDFLRPRGNDPTTV